MTEADARRKICCGGISMADAIATTHEAPGFAYAPTRCFASECMAWRWERLVPIHPDLNDGYCGLAGRPHAPPPPQATTEAG